MFSITFQQILTLFTFISLGYLLSKIKVLPEDADKTIAKLLTYLFVPALSLSTQINNCNINSILENYTLVLYGAVIVVVAIVCSYTLSMLFVRKANTGELIYQRNIYRYAIAFGNYGFMGNYIVLGIWGSEQLFKYQLFCFIVGIFCTIWGLYILIPRDKNDSVYKNIKKGLLAPPMMALVLGITLGILGVKQFMPQFIMRFLSDAGKCQGPVAMILAGVVIAKYKFIDIIFNKKVYFASALRLLVIPAIIMIVLHTFNVPKEAMTFALICFAAPLGLNTIVYPATYGGDTRTGASMTTISHVLSVITIPVMYYIFIELL